MALEPSIILGGRTVDVAGAIGAGNALADQTNELRRKNAMAELYRTQGAGILAGDQNAMNALAAISPEQALGFQKEQLGMDYTKQEMAFSAERMAMEREKGKKAAADALAAQAATLTAEQIAAERKAIADGLSGAAFFYQNKDKAGYDRFLTQNGMDPAQFPFEEFPAHAAMFEGALDAMDQFAPAPGPEWIAATPEQAAQYGATAGQINTKTGEFKKSGDGNGITQTITHPDGTTTTTQVGGSGAPGSGLTSANMTDVNKTKMAFDSIAQGLDEYERIFSETGGRVMPGAEKDSLLTARRGLQLQMKELFNLGVINGPDLAILDALLVDPTSIENNAMDALGVASLEERVKSNLDQVRILLKQIVDAKMSVGVASPVTPSGAGSGSPPAASPSEATTFEDAWQKY